MENINQTQFCKGCKEEHSIEEFYIRKETGKPRAECKKCFNIKNKERTNKNKDKIKQYKKEHYKKNKESLKEKGLIYRQKNKEKIINYRKEYYQKNKEKLSLIQKENNIKNKNKLNQYKKEYYQKNKVKLLQKHKEYTIKNKKKIREYQYLWAKNKFKQDPYFKLRENIFYKIRRLINNDNNAWEKHLGFTIEELKHHLESKFEYWMNWDNHGKYLVSQWKEDDKSTWTWHIDHITPKSLFDYTSIEDESFKKCWALNNLRPYSAKQNVLDGATKIRHKELNNVM